MRATIAGFNPQSGIFPDGILVADIPPVDILAGFDIVAQFSRRLLQAQVARSLSASNLSAPSAFVPWGTITLPASLLSALPPPFVHGLAVTEARLELRLVGPYLAAFDWPLEVSDPSEGPVVASGRRARRIRQERTVKVGWRLEINVLRRRPDRAMATEPTGGGTPPSGGGGRPGGLSGIVAPAVAGGGLLTASEGAPSGSGDGNWERFLLASGHAVTPASASLTVASDRWRFGMGLDFSETSATVTSDVEGVTAFTTSDAGTNMLAQALARLKGAAGLKLTPDVAPGGALSPTTVQRMNLPPFEVRDLLLTDARGEPVLCLCAALGAARGGVARLVQPVLERQDFAYAVSTDVLSPALKTRWNMAAAGLTLVGEVPVDLPVGDDPNETEPGRAQLQISFSSTLDDVAIVAAMDQRGDPLRLLTRQRVQLLNLWRQNGERITELGELAKPEEQPFALPLYFFERSPPVPTELHPNFQDLLLNLMAVVALPLLERFPVNPGSLTGFASSPMKTMFIRWSLKSVFDDVRAPISGVMEGAR